MIKKYVILSIILFWGNAIFSQTNSSYNPLKKGKMYAYWGWNYDAYSKSDISLKGADYNIKLSKVKATDSHTEVSYNNYLKLDRVTIPQTNFRIGYFIKNNLAVSLGVDHMKYVMQQNQTVNVKGVITRPGIYAKTYNGPQVLTEDFLTFEHTDGLNYVHAEVEKYTTFYHAKTSKLIVNGYYSGGLGILLPKSNVKFLDYERTDRYHVSGFGVSAATGLQAVFFKRIILRLEGKAGYINMPNIILHKKGVEGKGKQQFFFAEGFVAIGGSFSF
jgi:hypothetical protein